MSLRHLLHVYPTFAVGGAQMRLCAILNHYGQRWRHSIVALDRDIACGERLDPGLLVDYPAFALPKGATFGNVWRIRRALRAMRPDMVITSNWGSIEWAMANRGLGIGHLHLEDGFGPEERDRQLPRRVWTRRICLARRNVVVPSRTLERIALEVWRLDRGRVGYIPNGVDLRRFARHGISDREGVVIGTVATLRAEKNLARLLRAFAGMDAGFPARLVIVGDGAERGQLEALAGALGLSGRVTFAGHQADPGRFYAGFDIFALSSDTEQMPLSVLEAMAAGLPIVSTNVGDISTMVAPANARWLCPRDDSALTAMLNDAAASVAAREQIGTANRRKAEQDYAQGQMFGAYAALFDGAATLRD